MDDQPSKPFSLGLVFLDVVSAIFWRLGFGIYSQAKSAVHEIEALAASSQVSVLIIMSFG
jgi:hypothetical protein